MYFINVEINDLNEIYNLFVIYVFTGLIVLGIILLICLIIIIILCCLYKKQRYARFSIAHRQKLLIMMFMIACRGMALVLAFRSAIMAQGLQPGAISALKLNTKAIPLQTTITSVINNLLCLLLSFKAMQAFVI